jgi:hypothetical protein
MRLKPLNRALNALIVHKQKVAQIGQNLGGDVMAYKQGGAANSPVFDMALTSSLTAGTGTLDNFTRATGATVMDFEGVVRNVKSDEARFLGARRVENLAPQTRVAGFTTTPFGCTVEDVGDNTVRVTTTGTFWYAMFNAPTVRVDDILTGSLEIRKVSATGTLKFSAGTNAVTGSVDITSQVTEQFQRFTETSPTNNGTGRFVGIASISGAVIGDVFEIRNCQLELTTGQNNQSPSEFVGVGVGTGLELQPNGDFGVDDTSVSGTVGEWTWGSSNWKIENGRAEHVSSVAASIAGKTITNATGKLFQLTYELGKDVAYNAPTTILFAGTTIDIYGNPLGLTEGVHHHTVRSLNDSATLSIVGSLSGFDLWVDNVSIKEIDYGSNVDGVKYFETTNPNKVVSNLVESNVGNIQPNGDFSDEDTTSTGTANDGWEWPSYPDEFEITNGALRWTDVGSGIAISKVSGTIGDLLKFVYTIEGADASAVAIDGSASHPLTGTPWPKTVGTHTVYVSLFTSGQRLFQVIFNDTATILTSVIVDKVFSIPDEEVTVEGWGSLGLKGVLIEEASTNYEINSEPNNGWAITGGTNTANDIPAPMHQETADKFTEDTNPSFHFVAPPVSTCLTGVKTHSVYVRYNTMQYVQLSAGGIGVTHGAYAIFDLLNGTIHTAATAIGSATAPDASIERVNSIGNQPWYKISVTYNWTNVSAQTRIVGCDLTPTKDESYTGTGKIFHYAGHQIESLPQATSYIPTSGATANRGVEELLYDLPNAWAVADLAEFSFAGEFYAKHYGVTQTGIEIASTTSSDVVSINTAVTALWATVVFNGTQLGTTTLLENQAGTKICAAYESSTLRATQDGAAEVVDSLSNPPSLDLSNSDATFKIGRATASFLNGASKNVKLWDKALTEAQRITLTS